jgi:hypothetical protein
MISGVITTRHVIRHVAIIVREFGAAAYLRCIRGATAVDLPAALRR